MNKRIAALVGVCMLVVFVVVGIVLYTHMDTDGVPEVAVEESVQDPGYRYELTDKEKEMVRQFSVDMHNQYNLESTTCYAEDLSDVDTVIHVSFTDDHYKGEVECTNGSTWTARLSEVK